MSWNSVFAPKIETKTLVMPAREQFEGMVLEGWEPFVIVFRKSSAGGEEDEQKERVVRYGVGPA